MAAQSGYAKTRDGAHLAYNVTGSGPIDLLYASGYTISLDSSEDEPHVAHLIRRLASFSRLIRFDARGIGSSDPIDLAKPPTPADACADILSVLDAAECEQAAIVADTGSGGSIELAATRPERVRALVLVNSAARYMAADDYPDGYPREVVEQFLAENFDPDEEWTFADSDDVDLLVATLKDDRRFRDWWVRASRRSASPATARALVAGTRADLRHRLPDIVAPTLVLHARDNGFVPTALGRYLAAAIHGATFVEIESRDNSMFGLDADMYLDQIEEFLTGKRGAGAERVLATVLFTDIVDSTGRAAALGDREWRGLLDTHDALVRREMNRFGGREVNTTGDGFLGTFESPTQAVRAARAMIASAAAGGVAIRIGVHTGECERRGDDLAGLTVHIAARVAALAASGEVLVSRTVRDLVGGSELRFVSRGDYQLKGVPDTWQLFALE